MVERLRLLIADDEPPARARLKRLLAAFADVEVVAEACDGLQALALTEALSPDALFLDVQMPEAGGLDVAASLPEGGPAIVFVTAFDRYALQAFDAAAVDYLLKPVDSAHLLRAIERLRQRHSTARRRLSPSKLLVTERGQVQVIAREQIQWLKAADNYVELHVATRTHLLRRTLDGLLVDLGPGFIRTHRSHAVALSAVLRVDTVGKGDASVLLSGGERVPCSRAFRAALVDALATG